MCHMCVSCAHTLNSRHFCLYRRKSMNEYRTRNALSFRAKSHITLSAVLVVPFHLQLWLLLGDGMQNHSTECGPDLCACGPACVCPWTFAVYSWVWKCAGSGNFTSLCVLAAQRNIWCSLCSTENTRRSSFLLSREAFKYIPTRTLESGGGRVSLSLSLIFCASLSFPPSL